MVASDEAQPVCNPVIARPLSDRIGVEGDLDLSKPLDEPVRLAVRDLLHTHGLIVARRQSLTPAQHIRLVESFGPVPREGFDGASVLSNAVAPDAEGFAAEFARSSLAFHSDDAFSPDPTRYISLHALDIVDGGSVTRFANAAAALADLPKTLRRRLDGLEALHVFGRNLESRNRLRTSETNDPHSFHPLVWAHPVTGVPILYANYLMTDSIHGLALVESDALIETLFDHLYTPRNVYDHVWRTGDLLLWDNFLLQHARGAVDARKVGPRTLHRVISATKGFMAMHPQFRAELHA